MEARSITRAPEVRTFRLRQEIKTSYRDMQDADSNTEMLIEARRDPPAVQTSLSTDGAPPTITLIIRDELWTLTGGIWSRSNPGATPDEWASRAYREIGDMSLVAPLSAQAVLDAGNPAGTTEVNGTAVEHVRAGTDLMVRLLMSAFNARRAGPDPRVDDQTPPDRYINRYEADLWLDPRTGFVLRERTIIEYTEERLHGRIAGTGPATFETTREFFDLNAEITFARRPE